jgi:hypothetical protein
MRRFLALLIASCSLTFACLADGPKQKASWQWTVEERISARTDEQLARVRVRERGRRVQAASTDSGASQIADAFDGKTHPELFLPHQVFDSLIMMSFVAKAGAAQRIRDGLMPEITRRGWGNDFWDRLQAMSTIYVGDERALTDALESADPRSKERTERLLTLRQNDICRSRAEALAAARRTFGAERFDRFLYEVIAVNMFSMADRLPDAALLRAAEEGCR